MLAVAVPSWSPVELAIKVPVLFGNANLLVSAQVQPAALLSAKEKAAGVKPNVPAMVLPLLVKAVVVTASCQPF